MRSTLWLLPAVACGTGGTGANGPDDSPYPPTSCFVGAVMVDTPAGPRRIDALQVGDEVLAFDVGLRALVVSRVTHVHRARAARLGRIVVGERVIDGVTGEHPFYDPERGRWAPASTLAAGAPVVVRTGDGTVPAAVSAVAWRDEDAEVFNLTVAGPETYFAEGVLVHNKSPSCIGTTTTETVPLDVIDPVSGQSPLHVLAAVAGARTGPAQWGDGVETELTIGFTTDALLATRSSYDDTCGGSYEGLAVPGSLLLSTADGALNETLAAECWLDLEAQSCGVGATLLDLAALTGTLDLAAHVSDPEQVEGLVVFTDFDLVRGVDGKLQLDPPPGGYAPRQTLLSWEF